MRPRTIITSAILALGLSCRRAPEQPSGTSVITGAQLDAVFEREEIWGYPLTADKLYSVPSLRWFTEEFPRQWHQFAFSHLTETYQVEANDCDDWTRGAAFFAQLLHSRSKQGTALAVGEFWYEQAQGRPHALLAAVCHDGSTNFVIAFVEPQGFPRAVTLQKAEYQSCIARRF